jgi:hypothetical protein
MSKPSNRWIQREYKFSLDLPQGWTPVLAPGEVALLFANGPPHGVWSDNLLVLAHDRRNLDLGELAKELPDRLLEEDPTCEVLSCKVVPQGKSQALETVVRTRRGSFSRTIIDRRFHGTRFDQEVKFTVDSQRFDPLTPKFRQSFDNFRAVPGDVPQAGKGKAA